MLQRPTSKASLLLSQTWGSSMQLSAFGLKQASSTRYIDDPIQHLNPEMLTFYQIRFFCLRVGSVKNWISCWNCVHFFRNDIFQNWIFFVQKALRCATFVQSSPDQCIAVGNLGFLLFRRKKMVVAKACISRSSVPENSQHLEKMDCTGNEKRKEFCMKT
jgi:hypothetical protein